LNYAVEKMTGLKQNYQSSYDAMYTGDLMKMAS